jgi:dTDP-glucose pyrophosphorylase
MTDLANLFVTPAAPIRDVMACIDRNMKGVALVVDAGQRLVATVTDGDIRRAILRGVDLDRPVERLVQAARSDHQIPITVPVGTPSADILELMTRSDVRHVPVIDAAGRVVDLIWLADLVKQAELPLRAMIMAGGFGRRLRPLTDETPKAMLPVGDRPLLEQIVGRLREAGIRRVNVATHYRADVIQEHFGDGRDFGVEIRYVNEGEPLGTAGALGLLAASDEPILVVNGDILTQVDFRAMLDFHRTHRAEMTVAVRPYELRVPYGVVQTDGVAITGVAEKPTERYLINAGMYLLNPDVCDLIPANTRYDMTQLIERLVAERRRVVSFPIREYWLDIGQSEDYEKAVADMRGAGTPRT